MNTTHRSYDQPPFWIVWSPQGVRPPKYKHASRELALAECIRLAEKAPGHDFYVMECVGHAIQPGLMITTLQPFNDEIPF